MCHICINCNAEFTELNELITHNINCIPNNNNNVVDGNISELTSLFKSCLDILRNDAEHLIGDEALHELSHFLILKLSEKHILNGSIDIINNLNYYKDSINKYGKDKFLEQLEYVKFSKLTEYINIPGKAENIKHCFDNFIWKDVLSKHPKFKDVFEEGKKTFIKESKTFVKIINALNAINFNNYSHDILGEAYESVFVDAVFGAGQNKKSELGQFFTPTKVKQLMVNLINPILKDDGTIESFLEPAAGTGGILNTVIKHYQKYIKLGKITEIELRQQLINNMNGIEIKGKIYNLCLSNMLINTGEILPLVICNDSIRKYHNIKVDTICANPPFSVTINWDELLSTLGSEDNLNNYIPIKAGGANSEVLFLQMMIHCLNINGRCTMVWLNGTKLYSNTSGYNTVREYLMKSCDLQKVILCPSGTFTSTAAKTCILFFIKKKERNDVLEITGIGKTRKYKFIALHATDKVKFYNYNINSADTQLINEVDIKDIALNNYSLKYDDYNILSPDVEIYSEGVEVKTLGAICIFLTKSKRQASYGVKQGQYQFYTSSQTCSKYCDKYDYEDECLIIGTGGNANIKYSSKFSCSTDNFIIKINTEHLIKYIYYYLLINIELLQKGFIGVGLQHISKTYLINIKIPIPPLERQKEIVDFLDKLYETIPIKINDTSSYYNNQNIFKILLNGNYILYKNLIEWQGQSHILTEQIQFIKNRIKRYLFICSNEDNVIKTLGEICKFLPKSKRQASYGEKQGQYQFYTSSQTCSKYCDEYDYEDECLIIGTGGNANIKYSNKFSCSTDNFIIKINTEYLIKYIYYYLLINIELLQKGFIGVGLQHISKTYLIKIKIPVPPLERQKEIVEYCEYNDMLIKQLEKEIENNKLQAQQFIANIVKTNVNFNHLDNDIISGNTHNTIDDLNADNNTIDDLNDKHNTIDDLNDLNNTIDDLNDDNNDNEK